MSLPNANAEPMSNREGQAPSASLAAGKEIHSLVEHGRTRLRRLSLLKVAGLFVALLLLFLWVVFRIDNAAHLPVWARSVANGCFVAGVAWFLLCMVRVWRTSRFTHDQVALAIEQRAIGRLQNRLVNAIQLSRKAGGVSASAADAAVRENCRFLAQAELPRSVAGWPAATAVSAAALALAVGAALWIVDRDRFANAAARIFLPLADIAPLYRTALTVDPGDVTAAHGEDVTVDIGIRGQIPDELFVLGDAGGARASNRVAVAPGSRRVQYTFESVRGSTAYSVRGGDFTTRTYRIHVPLPLELARFTAALHYPQYTGLPDRSFESGSGDVEAVAGTRGQLTFAMNQEADGAWMILKRPQGDAVVDASPQAPGAPSNDEPDQVDRVALEKIGPAVFAGEVELDRTREYRVELHRDGSNITTTGSYKLVASADQPPRPQLNGVESDADVLIDDVLPLVISAQDDYGLAEVALCTRPVGGDEASSQDDGWRALETWVVDGGAAEFNVRYPLPIGVLDAVEGETLELAVRGLDRDPRKQDRWTWGPTYSLRVSGTGTALQLLYERIVKTEADLRELITANDQQTAAASKWIGRLGAASGLSRDSQNTVEGLAGAIEQQVRNQSQIRQIASDVAKNMIDDVTTLRTTLGMLADTELVRCIRMIESVSTREHAHDKRTALTDARLTQRRVNRSLESILGKYVTFRRDWELAHMVTYTRMLAERQGAMADASQTLAGLSSQVVGAAKPVTAGRRQLKLLEMAGLAQRALAGLSGHEDVVATVLAEAFKTASSAFDSSGLKTRMREAGGHLAAAQWSSARSPQRAASEALASIHDDLRKAQVLAARNAMESLQELAAGDLEAQQAIQNLKPGFAEALADLDVDELQLKQVTHMRKLAANLRRKRHGRKADAMFGHEYDLAEWVHDPTKKPTGRQRVDIIKLAEAPGAQWSSPKQSNRRGPKITGHPQEDVGDLVGDLLEEADELRDDYESYYLMSDARLNDPGEISKQSGDISHMQGAAVTGNMKPPTNNVGGASRTGRQGARAFGYSLDTESINRRGRDEVQEGLEEVAEQKGRKIETLSKDSQKDTSSGIGGKLVDREEAFNTKDAGRWKDSMVQKLRAAKSRHRIVERQGAPLDPRIAERMRDTNGRHDQVIDRIKALKKELDRLYLPSDHLDELMKKMAANLDRLTHMPDPEIFRQQVELLDRLAGAVVVFGRPESVYQQTLPREQIIRGRILDEPARPTPPHYEEAVSRYYEKLSGLD